MGLLRHWTRLARLRIGTRTLEAQAEAFCLDGPGAGQGDLLTGGFTIDGSGSNNVTNAATGCTSTSACAWPRQANELMLAWMNSFSPTPSNPTTFFAACAVQWLNGQRRLLLRQREL